MTFRERLIKLDACPEAVKWVGDRPPVAALAECPRADWALWLLAALGERRAAARLAAACARRALRSWEVDPAPLVAAIEAAERWAADPSEANRSAAGAAWAAAGSARDAALAAGAAGSEAWAALAAWSAAGSAAGSARDAALAAWSAAWSAAGSARDAAWAAWSAAGADDGAAGTAAAAAGAAEHLAMMDLIRADADVRALCARLDAECVPV